MMFQRSSTPEPVLLATAEAEEVKGGFLLLALLSACTGCPDGTESQRHAGVPSDSGGSGS